MFTQGKSLDDARKLLKLKLNGRISREVFDDARMQIYDLTSDTSFRRFQMERKGSARTSAMELTSGSGCAAENDGRTTENEDNVRDVCNPEALTGSRSDMQQARS